MSSYVKLTFADGQDTALKLEGEEWVRLTTNSSSWTRIRVGVLAAINPNAAANVPLGYGLVIGMCSGMAAPFGFANTTNFVGAGYIDAAWSYQANAGQPFFACNTGIFAYRRLGAVNTKTTMGGGWNAELPSVTGGSARRAVFIADILKGSPNYTVTSYTVQASGGPTPINEDYTVAEMLAAIVMVGTPTLHGRAMEAHSAVVACDEAAGVFDTADVYCNTPGWPTNLYAVKVHKMS